MQFERLKEFSVLANSRNFRDAASKLGISPAVLTTHISALEKDLGVTLVNRNPRSMELTDEGKRFYVEIKDIIKQYDTTLKRIKAVNYNTYRSITIALSGGTMIPRLGPFLDTVNLQHPDIHLGLIDDSNSSIDMSLRDASVDLFFSYSSEGTKYTDIVQEHVFTTKLLVLVPHEHRLAHKASISVKELDGEHFVLYPKTAESSMRDWEIDWLNRSKIKYTIHEDPLSPSLYFVLVPVGKGITLCPWVMRDRIPPNTVALNISDQDTSISMYMFYLKESQNPYLETFLNDFRDFLQRGEL